MILLGVDGGGSNTRAVAVDEDGNLKAMARAGCGNYQILGPGGLAALITELVDRIGVAGDYLGWAWG